MTSVVKGISCMCLALFGLAGGPISGVSPLQKADELFLAKALDFNASQLDLAEKASAKTSRADVQRFANELIDAHKKLNKELIALASDSKIAVASGLSKAHRDAVIKMLSLNGQEFDPAFLKHTIRLHEDAIKLYETDGMKQPSDRVRSFAEQTLAEMRKHLKQARALSGE